ncbi:MAG: sigma-70 family RNA polymerase sigma factor [Elusimicrobia bacterium]|nr:sigma-70 family RNA polymerase sigma factor [Elusimicrobiota bacterium]
MRGVALAIREIRRQFLCLRAEDYEDLVQECLLHWLTVRQSYNPDKGVLLASYLHRVITNKLFSMVRLLHRAKRQGLNFPVSLEDELAVYAQDAYGRAELRIDFESALKDMSARQRRLCKLLGEEGLTIAQAGKRLKTPRTTLYTDLAQIKSIFRRGSFESY